MSETNKVAVLMPTRGLVFGKVLTALDSNLKGWDWQTIMVTGLPIPDAQNEMVRQALETDCDWLLLVEDDTVMPEGAFEKMICVDSDVVCVDYPVIGGWSTIARKDGVIQHCGLGCTLVKRGVFERLDKPAFITDKSIDAKTGEVLDIPMKYGGHDIFFGRKVRAAGFEIKQLEGYEAEHLRCSDLKRSENNKGTFEIYSLDKVSKLQEEVS